MTRAGELAAPYRVTDGTSFRLSQYNPRDTHSLTDKQHGERLLREGVEWLAEEQQKLYAQNRWAVLLIFQAMDAAGKDGVIRHVLSGVNPQGCQVYSFKAPTHEELDHDFLWRSSKALPERGRIGIHNRSYYEETLVARVHPEILAAQRIPERLVTRKIWSERFEDINAYERYLSRNGVLIRKFFLHVSKAEQKKRFLSRLNEPEKNWKFSASDVRERQHWRAYMRAYEEMIRHTATPHAPWYVVPADNKWFTRVVVAAAIVEALESLRLRYPTVSKEARKELATARAMLEAEA